ncbi:hypothetical protein VF21_09404 [Pseudogymnoascus sp. 05NY08]|nr:hypothetical protein VF21_09404 [Pseudogymnoascus sp. 05NY08]
MKREHESDEESDGQGDISRTRTSSEEYRMYNPGYSFVRQPVVQTKPSTKRPRVGDGNTATAANGPLRSEPEPKKSRALGIKAEPEEDLYGLEPGSGPSSRSSSNVRDIQTPRHISLPRPMFKLRSTTLSSNIHVTIADRPLLGMVPQKMAENPIVSTIKEKLQKAIVALTSDEPKQSENLPPWGKHFALIGPCPKMVNPALKIYGLGGIGLPLSERDAGFIANFNPPTPDPDTKIGNAVVDLTTSKITELSPYQLETTNPGWEKAVEGIVAKVAKKLKVPGGVANVGFLPCNMTLYGPGDMLKEHRESKKGKGVFGTLAICLPSKHKGGDLIVTHDDQVKVLSTEPQSAFGYSYIFWYANLITELTEISQGNRLVLMYDLIKIDSDGSENVLDAPTSFWQKMDQLESAFQFWKSNFSEQASSCPKFLAYALDNMYDEHKLSRVILQGDDYQRVNGLLQLCKRHGFIICLAKLQLRVGRERGGQIREHLEVQRVVQLDGTKVFDVAPLDASDIVQDNTFSEALNNGHVSGFIGSDRANIDQVYHRFAAILMPAESCIDFHFRSAKSSAAVMNNWIVQLTTACLSSNANEFAKIDLERACQLVIEDARQRWDGEIRTPDNSQKSPSTMDILLGTVIRGGIYLKDPKMCAACLSLVRFDIPMLAAVDAIKTFGLGKLQCELSVAICRFRAINKELEALVNIYQPFEGIGHSATRADMITWMKSHAEKMFSSKHIMFAEDGDSIAKLGVICGEAYLKET